jgi:Icc-related predicted phosphoesterase
MLLCSDVHGARRALERVAGQGEPLLILGDLINLIDYRDMSGIIADIAGIDFVRRMVRLRDAGDFAGARQLWGELTAGREDEMRRAWAEHTEAAYRDICAALHGATAFVTYGNVDRPEMLADMLPNGSRFVDAEVVEIEGRRVGFAGGGMVSVGTPGEVTEDEMADKLDRIGRVDIVCTHVPPAVEPLSRDIIGGRTKGSSAIVEYLLRANPPYHYFGDIHQPQANEWIVGETRCRNVGYFRATGRAVRHD